MPASTGACGLLHGPALYRIRVAGRLGSEWADRLGGLAVTARSEPGHGTVTELHGRLPDQAALMGVLRQLYGHGASLLSVESVLPGYARRAR